MAKPLILITNDDSYTAPGIRALIEAVKGLGDLVVVAPDRPQSGMGHAITVHTPLRLQKLKSEPGYQEYFCNGTPVDCVKLAVDKVLHRKPDLLVSGVNHGSNASVNVIYSGTMAAVIEGAMGHIPSVGFSLNDYSYDADFSHTGEYIKSICENVLQYGLPESVCLNVNFPVNDKKIEGVKICRQANAFWREEFSERKDPHGREYYWMKGVFENLDTGTDTDVWAIEHAYVSIVPVQYDLTAMQAINDIKKWKYNV